MATIMNPLPKAIDKTSGIHRKQITKISREQENKDFYQRRQIKTC
ncbi:hypothetical protein V6Z11_D09G076700 [Gossypium hirsutum]